MKKESQHRTVDIKQENVLELECKISGVKKSCKMNIIEKRQERG